MSSTSPVGTIAYIIDEEALLVRVNKGWQYIAVSVCFCLATVIRPHYRATRQSIDHVAIPPRFSPQLGTLLPIATPSPPTTAAPQQQPRPDMQASNLLTNGQDFEDGPTVSTSLKLHTGTFKSTSPTLTTNFSSCKTHDTQ